jgi:hypothetical protein
VPGDEPLPVPPFFAKDPLWISAIEKVNRVPLQISRVEFVGRGIKDSYLYDVYSR